MTLSDDVNYYIYYTHNRHVQIIIYMNKPQKKILKAKKRYNIYKQSSILIKKHKNIIYIIGAYKDYYYTYYLM